MGNVLSSYPTGRRDGNVLSESDTMDNDSKPEEECDEYHDSIDEDNARERAKREEMDQFREQLRIKREQRREILNRHKTEKEELEKSLEKETKAKLEAYDTNRILRDLLIQHDIAIPEDHASSKETSDISDTIIQMKEEFEKLKDNNNNLRKNLAESNRSLQSAYSDIADLNAHQRESMNQINALKDVVSVSKTMISLREDQLTELKNKLNDIERSLADREANMLSADLRQEYERQLQNIRTLRGLYEERARLAEVTRQGLLREVEEQKRLKQSEIDKVKELTTKVEDLEKKVDELLEKIENKNNQIITCQDETRGLQAEMSVVNKLFSQVLLGYKTKDDLDKLVHRLEENHGILTQMAEKEDDAESSSALPKLLLELVTQIEEIEENKQSDNKTEEQGDTEEKPVEVVAEERVSDNKTTPAISPEEIVQHLPKVWRVLMELLSHQNTPEESSAEKVTTCYKSVDTQNGPVLVPSVSQTYIRLKDLIMEKLTLIKEVNRMKQLNTHLESRLEEQEKKLSTVTTELSKTWHVVGRLRRYHHQLHTHEKILKYELQQKRKLLNELKEELEYCREKWEQAREKNTQSERDLRKLRTEFSSRKSKPTTSLNNSAESGYSDERLSDSSDSNDESEYVAGSLIRSKKKVKKSFETIIDSSTDFNLAAEREDPASDMIDVADLPLDHQEGDDHQESSTSDSCNSENLLKSEKLLEETEDELLDMANDSCTEESSTTERENSSHSSTEINLNKESTTTIEVSDTGPVDTRTECGTSQSLAKDPNAILENIQKQNESLVQKDEKLEEVEETSEALLEKTQNAIEVSRQIDDKLDQPINRPSSAQFDNNDVPGISSKPDLNGSAEVPEASKYENISMQQSVDHTSDTNTSESDQEILASESNEEVTKISLLKVVEETSNTPDFKAILENVRLQNERLARKDERLSNLEAGCSSVVDNITNIISTGDALIDKMDDIHKKNNDDIPDKAVADEMVSNKPLEMETVPSDSNIEAGCIADNSSDADNSSIDVINNKPESTTDSNIVVEKVVDNAIVDDENQPSTSNEIDHEARFAARDIRLKRLEEQTKSLVKKVKGTTSKGIKINYKLEELHNIYGSESSRAGTPSDNDESKSSNTDNENQENSEN